MKKLMIEVRVNEYMMRDTNKNVPWTAEELGRTAGEIRAAGASIIHFHARGPEGQPAQAPEGYAAAVRAIRANSDLIVNPTLGQITVAGQEERIRHIVELAKDPALRPEMAVSTLAQRTSTYTMRGRKTFGRRGRSTSTRTRRSPCSAAAFAIAA